jgi:hypothetical protein
MTTATDGELTRSGDRTPPGVTPLRPLQAHLDPGEAARVALLRRLATDRLRDLRDEGLTQGYIARMYEVERATLEELMRALGLTSG